MENAFQNQLQKEYDELMGFKIDKPVFSESVRALEGKELTIKGYIIPIEGYKSHKEFIFSAFPYSMCFSVVVQDQRQSWK